MEKKKLDLIYLEDNADAIQLVKKVLDKMDGAVCYEIFTDGQTLLDYLSGKGDYQFSPVSLPKLALLDLRLPKMGGFDVLEQMRMNPHLRYIPVVILSSSYNYADITRAYELGANGFVKKAEGFRAFSQDINNIVNYWVHSNMY